MAELSPSPTLPSTADATPYVPVSWLAVAAHTVASVFALLLLGFGVVAFVNKKPLLEDWLLALPILAVVLSFAARRTIQNSEGTRTGILFGVDLVKAAWWTAVIFGLCYVAYLFAIDFAIKGEARDEGKKWMEFAARGDEEGLAFAFYRTLPPGARNFPPNDIGTMRARYRDEFLMFENSDLLRVARRNKGGLNFEAGSVTWGYRPGTIEVVMTGTVKCPEGSFPIVMPLRGVEGASGPDGGGRQWMIERPRGGGYIDTSKATRTPYGWLLTVLEQGAADLGREFVNHVAGGPATHAYAYRAFVTPGGDRAGWAAVARDPLLQFAFAIPARAGGDESYADYMASHFYKLPGGGEPSTNQKERFFNSWNAQGIRPAGTQLKGADGNPIDRELLTTVTDSAVEVRLPVEIPIPGTSGKFETARGRVVVECRDPAVLAELGQLKASANPDLGTSSPPGDILSRRVAWRVARIESDMVPISITPQRGPGEPPGMPGG